MNSKRKGKKVQGISSILFIEYTLTAETDEGFVKLIVDFYLIGWWDSSSVFSLSTVAHIIGFMEVSPTVPIIDSISSVTLRKNILSTFFEIWYTQNVKWFWIRPTDGTVDNQKDSYQVCFDCDNTIHFTLKMILWFRSEGHMKEHVGYQWPV